MKQFINFLFKNRNGLIRSGWIIAFVFISFYTLFFFTQFFLVQLLQQFLIVTGHIDPLTETLTPFAQWLELQFLPIASQLLLEILMITVPLITWRFIMKHPLQKMGLREPGLHLETLLAGMGLGFLSCTMVFLLSLLLRQAQVVSWSPQFSWQQLWWIILFILVALAEEILNRGFLMATLRRTNSMVCIYLIPSILFGIIHCLNPNVTLLSLGNIMLIGLLLSYMYVKSGHLWMCIGFHFTWNLFQGIVYGMPVSGLSIQGIVTTGFPENTLLNGGAFGIEGGLLTTLTILLTFLLVKYYYRKSTYHFISDQRWF